MSEVVEIFVTDDEGRPEEGANTFFIQREPKTGHIKYLGDGQKVNTVPDRTVGIARKQFEATKGEEGFNIEKAARILNEAEPFVTFNDSPTPGSALFDFKTQQLDIPEKEK